MSLTFIPDDKVMLISNYLAIRDVDLNDKENIIHHLTSSNTR